MAPSSSSSPPAPLQNLQVSITAAVAVKPSTIYAVKIDNTLTGQSWCVRRCYSDFYDLRTSFAKILEHTTTSPSQHSVEIIYPFIYKNFPKRSLFGSRRTSVVQYRVVALQKFLQSTLALSINKVDHHRAMAKTMTSFLSCPAPSRTLGKTCLPLRPTGMLLAGTPIGSNSTEAPSMSQLKRHGSDWSVAGDAVGLWAAAKSRKNSNPELRSLANNTTSTQNTGIDAALETKYCVSYSPTLNSSTPHTPLVFRELVLSKCA